MSLILTAGLAPCFVLVDDFEVGLTQKEIQSFKNVIANVFELNKEIVMVKPLLANQTFEVKHPMNEFWLPDGVDLREIKKSLHRHFGVEFYYRGKVSDTLKLERVEIETARPTEVIPKVIGSVGQTWQPSF